MSFRRKIGICQAFFSLALFWTFFFFSSDLRLLFLGSLLLFLQMGITAYLFRPIEQILDLICQAKEGQSNPLSPFLLERSGEFGQLGSIFNSLQEKIQKQIESLLKEREETEGILETLGEGIVATDPSARISFVNTAASRMLKIPKKELLQKPFSQIFSVPELCKKCHDLLVHALQTSETCTQDFVLREENLLYLKLLAAPLVHKQGALLVLQDKSSDFRMVEMGQEFVANASHELRTPVTIMRGFAETLQEHPDLPPETLREIIDKIVRTSTRLDKLIRSLLTLADIETVSEERFRRTDLALLLDNSIHLLKTIHPSVEITLFSPPAPLFFKADADLFELALFNILENSAKYSSFPAKIFISVEEKEETIRLCIRDEGIGIQEKDLPYIFNRFYTVDKARSRKSGGAGLGLSIVKTIVEKHRGQIEVSSIFGEGSSFTFFLPLFSKNLCS